MATALPDALELVPSMLDLCFKDFCSLGDHFLARTVEAFPDPSSTVEVDGGT